MEKTTKRAKIEAYLKEHQQASRKDVSAAIGREVFGPEISSVRKKLGIVYERRGRGYFHLYETLYKALGRHGNGLLDPEYVPPPGNASTGLLGRLRTLGEALLLAFSIHRLPAAL